MWLSGEIGSSKMMEVAVRYVTLQRAAALEQLHSEIPDAVQ